MSQLRQRGQAIALLLSLLLLWPSLEEGSSLKPRANSREGFYCECPEVKFLTAEGESIALRGDLDDVPYRSVKKKHTGKYGSIKALLTTSSFADSQAGSQGEPC